MWLLWPQALIEAEISIDHCEQIVHKLYFLFIQFVLYFMCLLFHFLNLIFFSSLTDFIAYCFCMSF